MAIWTGILAWVLTDGKLVSYYLLNHSLFSYRENEVLWHYLFSPPHQPLSHVHKSGLVPWAYIDSNLPLYTQRFIKTLCWVVVPLLQAHHACSILQFSKVEEGNINIYSLANKIIKSNPFLLPLNQHRKMDVRTRLLPGPSFSSGWSAPPLV